MVTVLINSCNNVCTCSQLCNCNKVNITIPLRRDLYSGFHVSCPCLIPHMRDGDHLLISKLKFARLIVNSTQVQSLHVVQRPMEPTH